MNLIRVAFYCFIVSISCCGIARAEIQQPMEGTRYSSTSSIAGYGVVPAHVMAVTIRIMHGGDVVNEVGVATFPAGLARMYIFNIPAPAAGWPQDAKADTEVKIKEIFGAGENDSVTVKIRPESEE